MRRYKVSVTTAADGTAIAYSPRLAGKIHSIGYVKDGVNGYATGVDFAITTETPGENVWNPIQRRCIRYGLSARAGRLAGWCGFVVRRRRHRRAGQNRHCRSPENRDRPGRQCQGRRLSISWSTEQHAPRPRYAA